MLNHNREEDILEDSEERIENEDKKRQLEKQHFASAYQLKSNEDYESNGYHYETDRYGRISSCEGNLRLEDGKRNTAHQAKAGGEYRMETDEGGHLIGRRFGGSEKVDNIVPMDHDLNHGEYDKLEDEWANELERDNQVNVKIRCRYLGESTRPTEFVVKTKVTEPDGSSYVETRKLQNGEGRF